MKFSAENHHYSFQEPGWQYRDLYGREIIFPFDAKLKVRHSPWTGKLSIRGPYGKASLEPLPEADRKKFLLDFFTRWRMQEPELARKAAFDYLDSQGGFVGVAFFSTLLFSLPMAVALLNDSFAQRACTRLLQREAVVGEMQVTKQKRKRKGHYLLNLAFTAPNGTQILGQDQFIAGEDREIPKTVPVIYAPSRPECWTLSKDLTGTDVNWAKRRVFVLVSLLFGIFFLAISLAGLAWSVARWWRKVPYRDEIKHLFQLQVK